ncbi:MAG TPA: glycosyltransferase family 9 protein [Methylophilaceae bacterium]|nr:glycosyltransferase family 9 protein [Methylophilaceae bacterium]
MPITKILFITLSNIGDVIMTTPVLEALHQTYPEAVIDIVGDARSDIVFKHCPYRGELFLKDKKKGWRGTLSLICQLRKKRYDIAVDLRSDGLLYLISAKQKYFKLSNQSSMNMHSVEKHFAAIQAITPLSPTVRTKIWLSDQEMASAEQWLAGVNNQRILALGLGANFLGKIWPVSHFQDLANALASQFDQVLLVGNQQDATLSAQFMQACKLPVIDCCGKLDLLTTAALLARASYFVGNDSGLGHIASAVGTPTFTVFGVGQPNRYRPWGEKALWYQDPQREIAAVNPHYVADMIKQVL